MSKPTPASPPTRAAYTPLPQPVRITEHRWPESTTPLVSVWCITYNHKDFIADAIEGFLMQETTFPVEILIHDDASTDGTADIVRDYQSRYPQLIRAKLQQENQYSQGKPGARLFCASARGEFIAFCEGDDYWTSPDKLQQQFEALAARPQCSACIHDVEIKREAGMENYVNLFQNLSDRSVLGLRDVIAVQTPFHTASFMVRKSVLPPARKPILERCISGDRILFVLAASKGEIVRIARVMGVYRKHPAGLSETGIVKDRPQFIAHRLYMWLGLRRLLAPTGGPYFEQVCSVFRRELVNYPWKHIQGCRRLRHWVSAVITQLEWPDALGILTEAAVQAPMRAARRLLRALHLHSH